MVQLIDEIVSNLEAHDDVDRLVEHLERTYGILNELSFGDVLKGAGHLTLDLAGFIPGYGEIADLTNAAWYAIEGEWLFAALSLVSLIPEFGDVPAKGLKLLMQGGKVAKTIGKGIKRVGGTKTGKAIAKGGEQAVDALKQFKAWVSKNGDALRAAIDEGAAMASKGADKIEEKQDVVKKRLGDKAAAVTSKVVEGLRFLQQNENKLKEAVGIFAKGSDDVRGEALAREAIRAMIHEAGLGIMEA